jgi:hypothetical protein
MIRKTPIRITWQIYGIFIHLPFCIKDIWAYSYFTTMNTAEKTIQYEQAKLFNFSKNTTYCHSDNV